MADALVWPIEQGPAGPIGPAGPVGAPGPDVTLTVANHAAAIGALEAGRALRATLPINVTDAPYNVAPAATAAANTTGLLAALAAANAAGRGVYVPTGIYNFNNPLSPPALKKVAIVGDGGQSSLLVPTSNTAQFLVCPDADDVTLIGIAIGPTIWAGARNTATSVEFVDGAGVSVRHCDIFNSPSIALAFVRCDRPHATANYIHQSRADAIHFLDSDRLVADNNTVYAPGDDGIAVIVSTNAFSDAMQGGSIKGNTVDGNNTGGSIRCSAAAGVAIVANQTKRTIGPGIRVGKTAGFGTTTRGCRRMQILSNVVDTPFPTQAGGFGGIEVIELDAVGQPVLTAARPNEDIHVIGNTVSTSGNASYEYSGVRGGIFANNIGIDSNNNTGAFSTCATLRNCTSVVVGVNVMEDRRGVPRSALGFHFADLTDCVVEGPPVLIGMTNPTVLWAGALTRVRGAPPTAPALLGGTWANYGLGYQTAGYHKRADGVVEVVGVVKDGVVGAPVVSIIFTLPAGYRPAANMIFAVATSTGPGVVTVFSTGEVQANSGGTAQFALGGVSFPSRTMTYVLNQHVTAAAFPAEPGLRCPGAVRINLNVAGAAIFYELATGWPAPTWRGAIWLGPGFYSLDQACDAVRVRSADPADPSTVTIAGYPPEEATGG